MGVTCWILGVEEEQAEEMLPDTISMGFPLLGDLSRFVWEPQGAEAPGLELAGRAVAEVAACGTTESEGPEYDVARWDTEEREREVRRALVAEFRRLYPGVLEARERHPVRIVDPFGLWMFSKKTAPRDLVVVHVKRGEAREAVAVVRITGPYFYREFSRWPHRLPVEIVSRPRFKLPGPYSGWGEVFSKAIEDSSVDHLARVQAGEPLED